MNERQDTLTTMLLRSRRFDVAVDCARAIPNIVWNQRHRIMKVAATM
jgi:hypothetical protein